MKIISILSITLFIILLIALYLDMDQYIPGFDLYLPFLLVLFLFQDIYTAIKYRKNKPDNEIRLRSKNDSYLYVMTFIVGSLISIPALLFLFIGDDVEIMSVLCFVSGLILIFKSLFFIPNALIKKEGENLYFENGKEKKTIAIGQIESIGLSESNITLQIKSDMNYSFQHLELSQVEIGKIAVFVGKYFGGNIDKQ